jgi:hypothetical protein
MNRQERANLGAAIWVDEVNVHEATGGGGARDDTSTKRATRGVSSAATSASVRRWATRPRATGGRNRAPTNRYPFRGTVRTVGG